MSNHQFLLRLVERTCEPVWGAGGRQRYDLRHTRRRGSKAPPEASNTLGVS
jgi:hypothetical protein